MNALFLDCVQVQFLITWSLFAQGYQNHLKVVYTQTKTPASIKHTSRYIPSAPDRILDAPDICDDYCKYSYISDSSQQLC